MKKLFLAYQDCDCEPFAYIFAEDEDSALLKAFEVAQKYWKDLEDKDIPVHEKRKVKDIKQIGVYHPKEDIYEA
jgi:hypothetical protein